MRRSLAIIALSTLALSQQTLWGAPPATSPVVSTPAAALSNIAATINGEAIALADVDAVLNHALPRTELTAARRRQMRLEVLTDIVDDVLLRQFLRKNGPKVNPAEIDAQLKAYGEHLQKNGQSLATFYRQTGQTETQVREAWTTAMQLTGYAKLHTTEAQLKAYHAANKDYFDHVEVRVRHILLRVSKNTPAAVRAASRENLEKLRAEIVAGKRDFATTARKMSHDPSARNGGDMGYIERKGGLVSEAFAKAAFALKPGEISGVVETEFGLHLIQAIDRKAGTPSTYDTCVTEVLDSYSDDMRAELIAKLRKEARIQISIP